MKMYNMFTVIARSTNYMFVSDDRYYGEVDKLYIKHLLAAYWRMLSIYHILDRNGYKRVSQVVDNFSDMLLDIETYYNNQMYPAMRKTLLDLEMYIFYNKFAEDVKNAAYIEEMQGRGDMLEISPDEFYNLFCIAKNPNEIQEEETSEDLFKSKYYNLNSDEQRMLTADDIKEAIKLSLIMPCDI